MLDLAKIKSEKLRSLIKNSLYFKGLTLDDQLQYLEEMAAVPEEKCQPLCEFFEKQNLKAKEDLYAQLQEIYEEVLGLKNKLEKLIDADPEKKSCEKDGARLEELIQELNNT